MQPFASWRGRLGNVLLLGAAAGLALSAAAGPPAEAARSRLRAGASAVKITPTLDRPVYIAGYDSNRVAESVHDDLWARAVVLDDGDTRFAVVSCDLVGLSNYRVRRMRQAVAAGVPGLPADQVLILTTHVHSGPDTLGLWGKAFGSSGMDLAYMDSLQERVVEAVRTAQGQLQPVRVSAAAVDVPEGFVYNSREPLQDTRLTAIRLRGRQGKTVASLIHYGAHPEVNKSKALTSDFVHYVREMAEREFGGTAIYLNGALGGMVTPKVSGHNFEEMRRVGEGVGRAAVQALAAAKPVDVDTVAVRRVPVALPLENQNFRLLLGMKILEGEPKGDGMETEVGRVDLGPITWITIPGEILPKPALDLKSRIPGPFPLVVSMANDEIGYILHPDDFDRKLYQYEKSMSVGKQTWPLLDRAARELLK